MDTIVLLSKISPPKTPPTYICRPQLDKNLTDMAERTPSLSLIIAPPGYGKTLLAASWVSGNASSAWLTIGTTDNIFISFIRYLSSSLKLSFPDFGELISSIILSPLNRSPKYIAEVFAYEIEKIEKTISVVIDNYHNIDDENIADFMTVLLDNMPLNLHLIILSQEDPPFSVPQRRLRENINEIRQSDLVLGQNDIQKIFSKNFNINLPEEYLKKIEIRTEGWPAAISLSALSLSKIARKDQTKAVDSSFISYNYIIDYFSDAIIADIDETILDFIIDTVPLETFTPSLSDFTRNRQDSESIILKLTQKHLPILIQENDHEWFRFHSLFADYIKSKYKNPNQSEIFLRASKWFEQRHGINSAIKYAVLSGDYSRIESLLISESETLFLTGKFEIISVLCNNFDNLMLKSPIILKVKLWADYLTHNYENIEIFNDFINVNLDDTHSNSGALLCLKAWVLYNIEESACEEYAAKSYIKLKSESSFYSYMANLIYGKSLLRNNKPQKAVEILSEAGSTLLESDFTFLYYAVINNLMYALLAEGKSEAALKKGKEALYKDPSEEIFKPEKSMILIAMARIYLDRNKLEKARKYAEKAHSSIHLVNVNNLMFEELSRIQNAINIIDGGENPRNDKKHETENSSIDPLSRREKEILILVSQGHSNQEISNLLFISIGTVKWHLNNIFSKLNVKNRMQLILKSNQLNLL